MCGLQFFAVGWIKGAPSLAATGMSAWRSFFISIARAVSANERSGGHGEGRDGQNEQQF